MTGCMEYFRGPHPPVPGHRLLWRIPLYDGSAHRLSLCPLSSPPASVRRDGQLEGMVACR